MARKTLYRQPSFDILEDRTLLAGNVLAAVAGGNLILSGDNTANDIAIVQGSSGPNSFRISGNDGTRINGQTILEISGVTGGLEIDLGSGDDTLQIGHPMGTIISIRSIEINTRLGADQVRIHNASIEEMIVELGHGDDFLDVNRTTFAGRVSVYADRGEDRIRLNAVRFNDTVLLDGDRGNDILVLNSTTLGQTPQVISIERRETELSEDNFQLSVHPDDPLLLSVRTIEGDLIDYFGTKNEAGFATAVNMIRVQSPNGDATYLQFDSQSRLTRILAPNGVDFGISWLSSTNILITATAADGSVQVNVPFNLTTQTISPTTAAVQSTFGAATRRLSLQPQATGAASSQVTSQATTQQASTSTSLVTVTLCGEPVDNAIVTMLVIPIGAVNQARVIPAIPTGRPGEYAVSIPTTPSNLGDQAESICLGLAEVLGNVCTALEVIGQAGPTTICPAITAAIAAIPGVGAAAAPSVFAACQAGFAAAELACATIGASPGPGAPSLADFLCGNIDEVIDAFTNETFQLQPTVMLPGSFRQTADAQFGVTGQPFPNFTIDFPGVVEIVSFVTSPIDPAPFQDYVATAQIVCADPGTRVVMSIVGTDGYTDSITQTIQGSATVSLFVPGAEADVRDTVTVQVFDPLGQLIDSRIIGLLF